MPTTSPDRDLYPLPEAAERLGGISRSLIYKMIEAGEIHTVRLGRRVFIAADEITRIVNGAAS